MTERVRIGQQRLLRMRRIGERHMIVMPPQAAKLMSIDEVEKTLAVARAQEQQTQQQLDRHRMFIDDLERQIAAFRSLPIERDADDPEVPQPRPVELAQQRDRPRRVQFDPGSALAEADRAGAAAAAKLSDE